MVGPIPEGDDLNGTRVPQPRQLCHLRSELIDSDRMPSVCLGSDSMEHQDLPMVGTHPSVDIIILFSAVHIEPIRGAP
jgi:hypothetical protein